MKGELLFLVIFNGLIQVQMSFNPQTHHRRSIRLKGYDYSGAGLYFITICVKDKACLFGKIVGATLVVAQDGVVAQNPNSQMILNDAGKMVESEWLKLPERFPNIVLHEYIVMPNHFHAILEIVGVTLVVVRDGVVAQNDFEKGQPQGIAPTKTTVRGKTVGDMVGAFQSTVTVNYIRGVNTLQWKPFNGKLWQRNYWEHIIRNQQSYQNISEYIINNPAKWAEDKFFVNDQEHI